MRHGASCAVRCPPSSRKALHELRPRCRPRVLRARSSRRAGPFWVHRSRDPRRRAAPSRVTPPAARAGRGPPGVSPCAHGPSGSSPQPRAEGGDVEMKWDERDAVAAIDRAIDELKRAAIDDGKNLETEHPPQVRRRASRAQGASTVRSRPSARRTTTSLARRTTPTRVASRRARSITSTRRSGIRSKGSRRRSTRASRGKSLPRVGCVGGGLPSRPSRLALPRREWPKCAPLATSTLSARPKPPALSSTVASSGPPKPLLRLQPQITPRRRALHMRFQVEGGRGRHPLHAEARA